MYSLLPGVLINIDMTDNNTDNKNKDEHICGCKTEVYSRVTGYYRPVSNWNAGKQEEFKERKRFIVQPQKSNCCGEN